MISYSYRKKLVVED